MKKYRRVPVIIEAKQWFELGDHEQVKEIPRWHEEAVTMAVQMGAHLGEWGFIETLEGGHLVRPGDWIIKGVNNEFYPCKDDIFQKIYEPVNEP